MANIDHENILASVLDQMDRHAQRTRLAIVAAAAMEALFMVVAILKVNWRDDTQVLLFAFSVLSYMIIALGIIALGAHVSRVGARVVAALEGRNPG